MIRISVIVPVFNTAKYLRRCLESILHQTMMPYEVILVDDGSTDGSAEICDEYAKNYPSLVHAIHQENQGAGAARNRGIERSTGDFLSFIDSDDYIDPDMYDRLVTLAHRFDADMAVGEMWVEKVGGERYCRVEKKMECCWDTQDALIELNSYRYLHVSFCTTLIARERMSALRFPEGQPCEDYALLYQVIAECSKIAYTSQPIYHYVQRPNSNSRRKDICLAPMDISKQQVLFFQRRFPQIAYAAETDCAFSHMGIYSAYIRNQVSCPEELLQALRETARRYLNSVLRNKTIPGIKKMQAIVFCISPKIYKHVIARTEHR